MLMCSRTVSDTAAVRVRVMGVGGGGGGGREKEGRRGWRGARYKGMEYCCMNRIQWKDGWMDGACSQTTQ